MRDLNFFSASITARKTANSKTIAAIFILSVAILIIGGVYAITEFMAYRIEKDTAAVEKYLNSGEVALKRQEIQNKKIRLDVMNKYYSTVDMIQTDINKINIIKSSLMKEINKTLPKDIFFSIMSFTTDTLIVKGTADSRVSIAELYHNLVSLGIFKDVHVPVISLEKDKNYSFDIQCTMKGMVIK